MSLTDADILDLMTTTQESVGPVKFNNISQSLTDYEAFRQILKRGGVKLDGGDQITRRIQVSHTDAARNIGLFEEDEIHVQDTMVEMTVPWRHTTTNWAWDKIEISMNAGSAVKLADLYETRRVAGMLPLVELMETDFWGFPDSGDTTTPFGVKYWIVEYPAATTTPGFYGGRNANFTGGPGGIDPNTYSGWRNYTGQFTNYTKDDLVDKMSDAAYYTRFRSPIDLQDLRSGNGQRYRIYTTRENERGITKIGEAQNENLGRDIDSMDGMTVFQRTPVIPVPELDSDTDNPLFMLDWAYWQAVFLRGWHLREGAPMQAPDHHNVLVVHVDCTWNILCTDRRRQACLSQARATNGSDPL